MLFRSLDIDAARYAENAYFVKRDEEECKDWPIKKIIKEMFSLADMFTMSAKKDTIVNMGGMIGVKDGESPLILKIKANCISFEGFYTYGGLNGRDLEALAELCDFPISVTMQDGTSLTVNSREDFITLGKESVFTRSLVHEIGIADPAGQQIYGNGIVMGNRNNIIINRMHGSLAVTGFNF